MQPSLFQPPSVDMSRPAVREPRLPINGKAPIARHCSQTGAESAIDDRASLQAAYLRLFTTRTPRWTDKAAARVLKVDPGTICSTRGGLKQAIVADGYRTVTRTNRKATKRTLWKLAEARP